MKRVRPPGRKGVGKTLVFPRRKDWENRGFPRDPGGRMKKCYHHQMSKEKHPLFNAFMQACLLVFTMLGFLLTGMKLPEYGLLSNLFAQIFWFYASYRAWKEADQFGIMLNTIAITFVLVYGVTNYWILT